MRNFLLALVLFPLVAFSQTAQEEMNFIREVNLARTNPKLYATYVKEYAMKWGCPEEKVDAPEVIAVLEKMQPLKPLVVSNQVRQLLENHQGVDTVRRWVRHGEREWLSISNKSSGENIIMSCTNTYRNMVIRHLIDSKVEGRGHRANILDPYYNTIAVRRIVFGDESKPMQCRIWWIEEYLEL